MVPRGPLLFTAISQPLDVTELPNELSCIALVISCLPQVHGVINHRPETLQELHDLTADSGLNLIQVLREELRRWLRDSEGQSQRLLAVRLALIVRLPKMRAPGRPTEVIEVRAFMATATVGEIGADIGLWEMNDGRPGLLIPFDETKVGQGTILLPLNAHAAFSRSQAADANGLGPPARVSIAAIGVGALGSQVVANLVRSGFGQWVLIDGDVLLPHNLARHALEGLHLGLPKALALAGMSNGIIDGERIAGGIVADILRPGRTAHRSKLRSRRLKSSSTCRPTSPLRGIYVGVSMHRAGASPCSSIPRGLHRLCSPRIEPGRSLWTCWRCSCTGRLPTTRS